MRKKLFLLLLLVFSHFSIQTSSEGSATHRGSVVQGLRWGAGFAGSFIGLVLASIGIWHWATRKTYIVNFAKQASHQTYAQLAVDYFDEKIKIVEEQVQKKETKFILQGISENLTDEFPRYYAQLIEGHYLEIEDTKIINRNDEYRVINGDIAREIEGLRPCDKLVILLKTYNAKKWTNSHIALRNFKHHIRDLEKIRDNIIFFIHVIDNDDNDDFADLLCPSILFNNPEYNSVKKSLEVINTDANKNLLNDLSEDFSCSYKQIEKLLQKAEKMDKEDLNTDLRKINNHKKNIIEKNNDYEDYKDKKMDDFVLDPCIQENIRYFQIFYSQDEKIRARREALELKILKGFLLYGPPGTGKSFFVKYMAGQLGALYKEVSMADILSKWVGQSEKHLTQTFETSAKKSMHQKTILFIDEVDSIATTRNSEMPNHERRFLNTFLQLLVTSRQYDDLIIFVATNSQLEELDPAFRRDGRFDQYIKFEYPTENSRKQKIIASLNQATKEDHNFDNLVNYLTEKTVNYTYAGIENLVKKAKLDLVLQENRAPVLIKDDFDKFFPKN